MTLVVFAYGFQVTKINLDEFRKESRQESRVRVIRALARPDILEYQQVETSVAAPLYIPCQTVESKNPSFDQSQPYILLIPACGAPGEYIQVEGFNFPPGLKGLVYFIPSPDPNDKLALQRGNVQTDHQGHFVYELQLPDRHSDQVQYLRVVVRQNVGHPHFSDAAIETWDKIIETLFLALLATTIGTLLAIPISFLAARNLMKDVKSSLTQISLMIIGLTLGIYFSMTIARWMRGIADLVRDDLTSTIIVAVFCGLASYNLFRYGFYKPENGKSFGVRVYLPQVAQICALLFTFQFLFLICQVGIQTGLTITPRLGNLAFLGNFITRFSDLINTSLPTIIALSGGAIMGGLSSYCGRRVSEKLPQKLLKWINFGFSIAAGVTICLIIGSAIGWLYEIQNETQIRLIPASIGALIGAMISLSTKPKEPLPIGLAIYSITRLVLNAVRSIEALIMAIVAVIWVGIGPFAGVLALGLHTIAALAKLYSEQVESILPGPLEAIKATGANRLQTIVYAVIPQIIPPYISFTMYRWDMNVRMSTIIGFAGGGGIGFLLIQNINLLNYRAASTQMLAIAIVVATMDYLSSWMRGKFV